MNIQDIMEMRLCEHALYITDRNKKTQACSYSEYPDVYSLFEELFKTKKPAHEMFVTEFGLTWNDLRWRGTMYHHQNGWSIRLRTMPTKIFTLNELDFDYEQVMRLVSGEGLTIFGGPTGAGKSTTMLAAMGALDAIHKLGSTVTIEDPVEYLHGSHAIEQRAVGEDTETFDRGIIEAMRFTPETIVIGEIRDTAAADAAVQAGLTGHRVLATLHANSVFDVIKRLQGRLSVEQRELMPTALQGIMVQRLEAIPNARPVLLYETLRVTETVRSIMEAGSQQLIQLKHEFGNQGSKLMDEMRQEYIAGGIIPA